MKAEGVIRFFSMMTYTFIVYFIALLIKEMPTSRELPKLATVRRMQLKWEF